MRLLKFGFGLLLLRWLPFNFVTRWLVRFAVWGGIAYALVRRFKPELLSAPMQTVTAPQEPSAWTAPPPRSPIPESPTAPPAPAPSSSLAAEPAAARQGLIAEAPPAGDDGAGSAPVPEIAGDEMVDLVVSASVALEDLTHTEETFVPRWVRGDGSLECPPGFPVKGNASSEIYHVPGSRNYYRTVPEVCFATAEDAAAAGYRPPLR